MFRFSIRELLLLTVVAAIGVAWFTDHSRLHAALVSAQSDAKSSDAVCDRLQREMDNIGHELPRHGLCLLWACEGPFIGEI